jgi:hypothetical protein
MYDDTAADGTDSPVMPEIPNAPSNLTVIAVVERAVDILRSKAGVQS